MYLSGIKKSNEPDKPLIYRVNVVRKREIESSQFCAVRSKAPLFGWIIQCRSKS